MARCWDRRGGGSADGTEPYAGRRSSPPEYTFVGYVDVATGDDWASLYRFSHVELYGDEEHWVYNFVTRCRKADAQATMRYRVSDKEDDWY
jgi:hypothetical protein